ncbi:MAG: hypothetical protein LBD74_07125 [Spirochaetaceae bacterium]|jgi:hypothetical protein|nr:hypothetical protein [Spirochaetaceae bacterium]
MDELRRRRSRRDEAIRGLSDRVYCQYYRCMVLRKKLEVTAEGSGTYEKRKAQLIRGERRYSSMKKRLSSP